MASKIERVQRHFLWSNGDLNKPQNINWRIMFLASEHGGLGRGRIEERNQTLLGSWLHRFPLELNCLRGESGEQQSWNG